jgi:hypothetical protein
MATMEPRPATAPACARCGRDAQFDFDQLWLCLECYHVAGSTCAGVSRPVDTAPVTADDASLDPVC